MSLKRQLHTTFPAGVSQLQQACHHATAAPGLGSLLTQRGRQCLSSAPGWPLWQLRAGLLRSDSGATVHADRLQRGQRAGSPQEESEDRSLAGTFVSMIRQQHAQRACLLQRGAQHLWKETDQMADCARCKKLSYITVAIDNTLAAVSSYIARYAIASLSEMLCGSRKTPSQQYSLCTHPRSAEFEVLVSCAGAAGDAVPGLRHGHERQEGLHDVHHVQQAHPGAGGDRQVAGAAQRAEGQVAR